MTNPPPINVTVQTGAGEVMRIAATLLMFGGAGALAWAVAQQGYAELAGTGLTVMTVQVVKMMWVNGLISLPTRRSDGQPTDPDIANIRSFAAANYRVLLRYQADSPAPRMVAIGFVYAVAFLVLRSGMISALTVFQNIYIAGGAAAILGSIVVMPKLLPNLVGLLKTKGVVRDAPAPAPTSPAAAPAAPAAPQQPVEWIPEVAPTRQTAAPTPPPAPPAAQTPAAQPVRRVVVRKKLTEEDGTSNA